MIPTSPAVALRVGPPSRAATDLDRYIRTEFADRGAAWIFPRTARANGSGPRRRPPLVLGRLLRAAQAAFAAFF